MMCKYTFLDEIFDWQNATTSIVSTRRKCNALNRQATKQVKLYTSRQEHSGNCIGWVRYKLRLLMHLIDRQLSAIVTSVGQQFTT